MSRGKRILKKDEESKKQLNTFLDRFNEEFDNLETNAKAFSLETGISQSSLSQYRNRTIKSLPSMKTIEKLAKKFGVSSNYLLGKDNKVKYDYEDFKKETGLSKKTYQILQNVKDTDLINTINYLIEQEEINLLGGFTPIYNGKEDNKKSFEKALQSYEKELEKVDKNCVPILSMIHNYYSTQTTNEEMYIVNGNLKRLSDFKYKIDTYLANAKISTNDIIEDTFLKEIENRLKKSKQKRKEQK